MLAILRILFIALALAAVTLAFIGLTKKSRRHLIASLLLLIAMSLGIGIAVWMAVPKRSTVSLPPVANPAQLITDAEQTLKRLRLTAFDDVTTCIVYLTKLTEFYGRYKEIYQEQYTTGKKLLDDWQRHPKKNVTANGKHYCSDEKTLYEFVVTGQTTLQRLVGPR